MKSSSKIVKKITGFMTAILFLIQQVILAPSGVSAQNEVSAPALQHYAKIEIPAEIGQVETSAVRREDAPVIIHVQDAHGNYDAQKNIQKILSYLTSKEGINLVLLEGGKDKLHPEVLNLVPNDPELDLKIADRLAHQAEVTGAEMFLLGKYLAKSPVAAYGLENAPAYRSNRETFQRVLRARQETKGFLKDMDMQIERLTAPYVNSALKNFLRAFEAYETHLIDLNAWLGTLKDLAVKNLDIDLQDAFYQKDWPMLIRYFRLQAIEPKMDRAQAEKEKLEFLKALRTNKIETEIIQKFDSVIDFPGDNAISTLPAEKITEALESVTAALPQDFSYAPYEHLKAQIQFRIFQQELRPHDLISEIERLESALSQKLARTETEKKILGLLKDYRMLKKLFALELTRKDYEGILSRRSVKDGEEISGHEDLRPSSIAKRFSAVNSGKQVRDIKFSHLKEIDTLYALALDFYKGAMNRDDLMADNVLKAMRSERKNKAVIVTGGFHSEGIKEYFENKGFSYISISPRIDEIGDNKAYIRAMLEENSDVKRSQIGNVLKIDRSGQLGANPDYAASILRVAAERELSSVGRNFSEPSRKRTATLKLEALEEINAPAGIALVTEGNFFAGNPHTDHVGGVALIRTADTPKPEILVGSGGGVQAHVKVYSVNGNPRNSTVVFPGFTGSVDVQEITLASGKKIGLATPGAGGGPVGAFFDPVTRRVLTQVPLGTDLSFRGGVNASNRVLNIDGKMIFATIYGEGGGPIIMTWEITETGSGLNYGVEINQIAGNIYAADENLRHGGKVALAVENGELFYYALVQVDDYTLNLNKIDSNGNIVASSPIRDESNGFFNPVGGEDLAIVNGKPVVTINGDARFYDPDLLFETFAQEIFEGYTGDLSVNGNTDLMTIAATHGAAPRVSTFNVKNIPDFVPYAPPIPSGNNNQPGNPAPPSNPDPSTDYHYGFLDALPLPSSVSWSSHSSIYDFRAVPYTPSGGNTELQIRKRATNEVAVAFIGSNYRAHLVSYAIDYTTNPNAPRVSLRLEDLGPDVYYTVSYPVSFLQFHPDPGRPRARNPKGRRKEGGPRLKAGDPSSNNDLQPDEYFQGGIFVDAEPVAPILGPANEGGTRVETDQEDLSEPRDIKTDVVTNWLDGIIAFAVAGNISAANELYNEVNAERLAAASSVWGPLPSDSVARMRGTLGISGTSKAPNVILVDPTAAIDHLLPVLPEIAGDSTPVIVLAPDANQEKIIEAVNNELQTQNRPQIHTARTIDEAETLAAKLVKGEKLLRAYVDISQVNKWSELLKEHKIDMESLGAKAYEKMVAGLAGIEARLAAYAEMVRRISTAA